MNLAAFQRTRHVGREGRLRDSPQAVGRYLFASHSHLHWMNAAVDPFSVMPGPVCPVPAMAS